MQLEGYEPLFIGWPVQFPVWARLWIAFSIERREMITIFWPLCIYSLRSKTPASTSLSIIEREHPSDSDAPPGDGPFNPFLITDVNQS